MESDACLRFRYNFLNQISEQDFIEAIQPIRAVVNEIHRLAQGVHDLLNILVLQQAAAFTPKLRQLGLDVQQLGGTGGGIQQALALECADLIALLRGNSDR